VSRVADALRRASLGEAGGCVEPTDHPWNMTLSGAWDGVALAEPPPAVAAPPTRPPTRQGGASPELSEHVTQQLSGLVDHVFLHDSAQPLHCIVFADASAPAHSGMVTAAVARLLAARTAARVCALDTAFAAPSLHEYFGLSRDVGLRDFLRGDASLATVAVQAQPNLWVVPAGADRGDQALASPTARQRLAELLGSFEFILAAAPPIGEGHDGTQLWFADAAILLIAADRTRRNHARQIAESLRRAGTPVLGTVLTNRSFPIPASIYKRL
jgi:Mrp family chromosome partitioning ATPase